MHMGNMHFNMQQYAEAERCYREALKENPRSTRAVFNLGDTYLAQNNPTDAMKMYTRAAKEETNKTIRAMSFHNIGYIHHKNKQYAEAIRYYKEALRNNPYDDDTRYNLALCQKQLKEKQQEEQQQQDRPQPEDPQGDRQQPEKNDEKEQKPEGGMSNENAEQLLNLSRQSERETREKLNQQQAQPRRKQLQKNW